MADPFSFRLVRGKSYRGAGGRFAKYEDVVAAQETRQNTLQQVLREELWNQRQQNARIEHEIRTGKRGGTIPRNRYNVDRDVRMQLMKQTPRDLRSKKQWKEFREDMEYFYGPDRDDWGEYD